MKKNLLQSVLPFDEIEELALKNINKKNTAPHPIPYQGSKRKLAERILSLLQGSSVRNLYEPFAGSGAISLASAQRNIADHYYLNDSLQPLSELWSLIVKNPLELSRRYSLIWNAHVDDSIGNFYKIRTEFNTDGEPAKLLYLLARCVKNAVRFNDRGEFNQSVDKRRLGTRPERMNREIMRTHILLKDRTTISNLDYAELVNMATRDDVIYMDPPYEGTSGAKDTRYHQVLDKNRLISELGKLNERSIPYILSFDGSLGGKSYGNVLPSELNLKRLEINAGRSSQATLAGRDEQTIESLYVSEEIIRRLTNRGVNYLLKI
jgi:DNA adenine methylase